MCSFGIPLKEPRRLKEFDYKRFLKCISEFAQVLKSSTARCNMESLFWCLGRIAFLQISTKYKRKTRHLSQDAAIFLTFSACNQIKSALKSLRSEIEYQWQSHLSCLSFYFRKRTTSVLLSYFLKQILKLFFSRKRWAFICQTADFGIAKTAFAYVIFLDGGAFADDIALEKFRSIFPGWKIGIMDSWMDGTNHTIFGSS